MRDENRSSSAQILRMKYFDSTELERWRIFIDRHLDRNHDTRLHIFHFQQFGAAVISRGWRYKASTD
jgi:hypothetical protein